MVALVEVSSKVFFKQYNLKDTHYLTVPPKSKKIMAAGLICCIRDLKSLVKSSVKSSFVIDVKTKNNPNPFTPSTWTNLVLKFCIGPTSKCKAALSGSPAHCIAIKPKPLDGNIRLIGTFHHTKTF